MKFQLLTTRAALSLACLISTTSCVSLIAKKNTYGTAASSPPVRVAGAEIRMQVKPEGTEGGTYAVSAMVASVAVATFDGPFKWRLEAIGQPGKQQSLIVHRVRTQTSKTQRDEWYPAKGLGRFAEFKFPKKVTDHTRAIYPIPGLLVVKPKVDGALEISCDLTITSQGKRERKLVHFRMDPSQKRNDEFIFVPTEIVKSIGTSPADWEDAGWD